jgi:RNA polymerase sigma-70 factor (ECF subfamily)
MGISDRELVARMAEGDRDALEILYRRHAPWLAGRLSGMTSSRDLAEEALQDGFMSAWRGAKSYRGEGDVGAWLWGITRRRLSSLARGRKELPITWPIDAPGADEAVLSYDEVTRVRRVIAELPTDQRQAIERVVLEEQPLAEVAVTMGVPIGTLKSRLHRARLRIRSEMEAS